MRISGKDCGLLLDYVDVAASYSERRSPILRDIISNCMPPTHQARYSGLRVDMLRRNVFSIIIFEDSGEVALAVTRTWMLFFTEFSCYCLSLIIHGNE